MSKKGERQIERKRRYGLMNEAETIDNRGYVTMGVDLEFTATQWSMLHDTAKRSKVSKKTAARALLQRMLEQMMKDERAAH